MFFNWLQKSIFAIFTVVLAIIVGLNIYTSRGFQTIQPNVPPFFNLITLFCALGIVILILKYRTTINKILNKTHRFIVPICLVFSVFLQLLIVKLYAVNPTWDFGVIVNSSKEVLENGQLNEYFIHYPNNIFMVLILAFIGNIFSPTLQTYILANIFVITLCQFLIYRIGTKVAGKSTGLVTLFISVSFFPYLFFAPIIYTDMFSLLFTYTFKSNSRL
ncbi:hypothetical protein LC087_11625 [Bacillus carboniphilus]|uniref:Glycosyltransferase RgtA/B/C/D-like domain-containing protein n=1 Tax=Bacillus carboniphilus TaxID=86663 RepID=A0ABY9JV25_9BACI|nr:hypothetical protein [Bacillus carboniphilus]WLR41536.1 hypothetical protein LC087_11625 [Bacillus carboniphilus]